MKGWQTQPFEHCIESVEYTHKIQRRDFLKDGSFPIVSQEAEFINGYWDDANDLFKVSTPVVIFGDHTQILKYVDFDFVLGADGVKILQPRNFLLPKFFYYQLKIAALGFLGYARHYKLLKEIQLAYPPKLEQQRIVGILDEAFEGIATTKANAEKNLQNARVLFEGVLNNAIQGKLISQNHGDASVADLIRKIEKLRSAAIEQGKAKPVKTSPIGTRNEDLLELPKSWKWEQLEGLTMSISDGVHKKPEYAVEGIPFVTVKNLTAGPGICCDDLNYITRDDHEDFIKRTHPEKGDILITKDGTIGVVRLIETDVEFSIFVSVALIKPVMQELGPYLVYALRASCVQSQIVPQGAALKHLYLVDLRRLARAEAHRR
jgi:type I restriction enzyme S subunit